MQKGNQELSHMLWRGYFLTRQMGLETCSSLAQCPDEDATQPAV